MTHFARLQLLAAVASLVLWAIPGAGLVLLPLEYFNTHIHELFHAIAATATDGRAHFIHVYGNGSGVTPISGGNPLLAASAGYVGAAFLGGLILLTARTPKAARNILITLAVVLGVSMLMWVRGDLIGIVSGAMWIVTLVVAARKLEGDNLIFAAQFLGIQQCLRSAMSLYVMLNINAFSGLQNDAAIAEEVTGIPRLVWALAWCAISAAWMGAVLWWSHSHPKRGRAR